MFAGREAGALESNLQLHRDSNRIWSGIRVPCERYHRKPPLAALLASCFHNTKRTVLPIDPELPHGGYTSMPVLSFGDSARCPQAPPSIRQSHRVDVWIFSLDCPRFELQRFSELLSPNEQARCSRFSQTGLAARWTVARARLRQILGSYLDGAPYRDDFAPNAFGKLRIKSTLEQPLHFNLSHSAHVCGVAVCLSGEIGLDIETIDIPPWDVEPDVFTRRERDELACYTGTEKPLAFYRGWTRKEAVIKAMGRGLSFPLQSLEVGLSRTEPRLHRLGSDDNPDWTITGLEKEDVWVGALAMRTAGASIEVRFRDTYSHFGTQVSSIDNQPTR